MDFNSEFVYTHFDELIRIDVANENAFDALTTALIFASKNKDKEFFQVLKWLVGIHGNYHVGRPKSALFTFPKSISASDRQNIHKLCIGETWTIKKTDGIALHLLVKNEKW